jgi:carboxyl-terminal processing protease
MTLLQNFLKNLLSKNILLKSLSLKSLSLKNFLSKNLSLKNLPLNSLSLKNISLKNLWLLSFNFNPRFRSHFKPHFGPRFVIFWILFLLNTSTLRAQEESRYSDLQLFARVLNIIEKHYVDSIEIKKVVHGAIKGMLKELDPHSAYMSPEVFKEFESETSGEFSGIGIEITIDNGQLTIVSPIEDTPAFEAGLQARDRITAINGAPTKGLNLIEASKHLRGRRGDSITLSILREGEKMFDVSLTRGRVKLKSVKNKTFDDTYLYIKITNFMENTHTQLEKVLQDHLEQKKIISGLILDLRKNPGGLLDQAVKVSDLFLKDQLPIVSTQGRSQEQKDLSSTSQRTKYLDFPLLVLIDSGSASASEIVAGALQDHKRALVAGSRSFGKGSVQSVIKLGDGSALKLTIARYYTPSGRSIQAEGIMPDLLIEDSGDNKTPTTPVVKDGSSKIRRLREKDMENHLPSLGKSPSSTTSTTSAASATSVTSTTSAQDSSSWIGSDGTLTQAVNYLKAMSYSNSVKQ